MQYAFCMETLFSELPFIERLNAAKSDGIDLIEFWDWRNKDIVELNQRKNQLKIKISNMSGNRNFGMIDQRERKSLLNEIAETVRIAQGLECPRIMLLAQTLAPDGLAAPILEDLSDIQKIDQIIKCGNEIATLADQLHIEMVIEPLNSIQDHPGYYLDSSRMAFQIIKEINHPRIKILYDIYHMAMMGENIIKDIEVNLDLIGYFHVADKPGRKEPGSGEIDFQTFFTTLKTLQFDGTVGFECAPSGNDSHRAVQNIFKLIS